MNEERLSKRAAEGDERAFATIFKCYHQELYRFCLTIVRNPQDAQDALQNTMVKTLRSLPGEKRHIELKPWLYRVAHNEAIELLRRHRATVELEPGRRPGESRRDARAAAPSARRPRGAARAAAGGAGDARDGGSRLRGDRRCLRYLRRGGETDRLRGPAQPATDEGGA